MANFDFGLDDKPKLRDYFEYHLPFYQELFANRISASLKFSPSSPLRGWIQKATRSRSRPTHKKTVSAFLELADDRRCDWLFKNNFNLISEALDYAVSFDVRFQGMPEIPIHFDYHPGNLKFNDDKGVGIFDFDWFKIDYRLLDVALCRVYLTSLWNDQAVGLKPDNFPLFLSTYKQACHRLEHISPLTELEHRYLVPMLSIAILYVLN